jgi:hypothetical protein
VEASRAEPSAAQRAANATGVIITCRACATSTRTVVAVGAAFAVCLGAALAAARFTRCARWEAAPALRRLDHLAASHEAMLTIALRQVQVLSLLYAASTLPFPPAFRAALNLGGSLGLNACLLNGWEFSSSWALRALLPLGALPLLMVDFARLRHGYEAGAGAGAAHGEWRALRARANRYITNAPQRSAHGYSHPTYSTIWLGFSLNLFLPFALMACTCAPGGVSFYDQSLPCPASPQFGWGAFFVALYVPAFAWFYVAPLFPCLRCQRPGGARADHNHRVDANFAFFAFRLFRQLPQLVNSFAVLLPGAPRAAATLLVATSGAEAALFFVSLAWVVWRQRTSPRFHTNFAPFETRGEQALYVGALGVVLATHGTALSCANRAGGSGGDCGGPSLWDYALVAVHAAFFIAFLAAVGAYLWADHGELEACEGSDFDPAAAAAAAPPLTPGEQARALAARGAGAKQQQQLQQQQKLQAPPQPPAAPAADAAAAATARPQLELALRTPGGGSSGSAGSGSDSYRPTPEDRAAARRAKEAMYMRSPHGGGGGARVAPETPSRLR